jgi:hypothetical protein
LKYIILKNLPSFVKLEEIKLILPQKILPPNEGTSGAVSWRCARMSASETGKQQANRSTTAAPLDELLCQHYFQIIGAKIAPKMAGMAGMAGS